MNAVDRNLGGIPAKGVEIAQTPEELGVVHRADVAAVVWSRTVLSDFQAWIDDLPAHQLPTARVILRPKDVHHMVTELCDLAGTPDATERSILIDDIAAVANIFATLMDAEFLGFRLDAVTTNACRKFHMDAMTTRLVCTYRGDGTEYGNAAMGTDPSVVHAVPTGSPILLRGSLWEGDASPDVLHRSPPIEGTGKTRLVLVLDPVSGPVEGAEQTLH